MKRRWRIPEIPAEPLAQLARETGVRELLARILWNRGMRTRALVDRYFEPRRRFLASPFLLEGMYPALQRILKAFEGEEKIRIFGDRDVDGITSTVLLYETIKSFTRHVDYAVPVIEDGYGLNQEFLNTARRDGVTLIITVDCGISNNREVEEARKLGIDVIITDHHETPPTLPQAVSVLDPKAPDSRYPHKELAGVGVAFKLALALTLAQSKNLPIPLVAFYRDEEEISAVRFTPREGFSPVRHLNRQALQGAGLLFWSVSDRDEILPLLPKEVRSAPSHILQELQSRHTPGESHRPPADLAADMNIPATYSGAERLVFLFLKFLEAEEPSVAALWQRALDVLTIGTIADMAPLRGENRTISHMGLKFITHTKRQGLQELFQLLHWKNRAISERDVSFTIAPILNSSGRLRSAELAISLLTTDFPFRAKDLAQELFELNQERKRVAEECYQQIRRLLLEQNDLEKDRLLVVAAPMPNQGVTGIVATRLMIDFSRPVIVLLEDQKRMLGSARGFKQVNIMNALNACSDLLEKYGGHLGAAGLTLPTVNLEEFRRRVKAFAAEHILPEELVAEWLIDAEITLDQVDDDLLRELQKFGPFGIDNPQPLFLVRNARFYEVRKVGETRNHLRFRFRKTTGQVLSGIGFNLAGALPTDVAGDGTCDIVFSVDANDYNGTRTSQAVIQDVLFHEAARPAVSAPPDVSPEPLPPEPLPSEVPL